MSETIQLRKRGVFTLPKSLRDKYHLEEGDALDFRPKTSCNSSRRPGSA